MSINPIALFKKYKPAVIKCDLEGFDNIVTQSLIEYSNDYKIQNLPLLSFEFNDSDRNQINLLKQIGYKVYIYKNLAVCYPNENILHESMNIPIKLIEC
jgi:hypothetical protein